MNTNNNNTDANHSNHTNSNNDENGKDNINNGNNTTDDGNVDAILFASRFLPHENEQRKTEIGILPTCIGRLSSTVLFKDGRIAGLRHVVDAQAIENLKSR